MIRNSFATGLLLLSVIGGGFEASVVAQANTAEPAQAIAILNTGRGLLEWIPLVESEGMTLSLADPQGVVRTHSFPQGEAPALSLFDTQGAPLPDGTYTWELRVTPRGNAPLVQSGYFTILDGNLVASDLTEPSVADPRVATAPDQMVPDDLIIDGKGCIGLGCVNNEAFGSEALRLKQSVVRLRFQDTSTSGGFPTNDWQITVNDSASGGANRFSIEDLDGGKTPFTILGGAPNNSLYVDANGRLGLGTATPAERLHIFENVDGNTIITAENTNAGLNAIGALRARSNSAIVNFQAHGSGRTLSRFGQPLASWAEFLQVAGNGLIVGTLADKPLILGTNNTNRIHIAPNGNIGFGTATPAQDLHIASGSVPTLRLEQAGGTARAWDVGASDTSFFVEDVTNASAIPFRVGAGAATGSLEISSAGFIGIGTSSPATRLHVKSTDPTTSGFEPSKVFIENASSSTMPRELLELRNNGNAAFIFKNIGEPQRWLIGTHANHFIVDNQATGVVDYSFGPTGNLTLAGTLTQNSDRTTKTDVQTVDPRAVLARMAELPISTWRKIGETSTHLGPMAQDFRAAFGLGEDERHIAPGDLAGVSLAAIQGLHALVEEQRQVIGMQKELIAELEKRLRRLEAQEHPLNPGLIANRER